MSNCRLSSYGWPTFLTHPTLVIAEVESTRADGANVRIGDNIEQAVRRLAALHKIDFLFGCDDRIANPREPFAR
jgi:hypothetical protein